MNPLLSAFSVNSSHQSAPETDLFLCLLSSHALLSLEGEQSMSYLQGQLSCDMAELSHHNHLNAAHCDAKGKMWAILKTFTIANEQFFLSGHRAEITASLEQLNKYGVFAKTTITDVSEQWITLGLGGAAATDWLAQRQVTFEGISNAADLLNGDELAGKVLKVAPERYLLLVKEPYVEALLAEHKDHLYSENRWHCADIQAGIAHLDEHSISQYVPQMLNLQALQAISFSKGCYTGQEMIARMKYLGKNKRAAYVLHGHTTNLPSSGADLQLAIGDNWRRSGTIVNVAGTADDLHILAVLPHDLAIDAKLRIKDDESCVLKISPLPYSLESDD